tara:strand:- start:3997 stop:4881 length:885 start_codon:yes stop_codon:yes gene_type:complete
LYKTYNLIDGDFAHDLYSVAGQKSSFIKWDRKRTNPENPTFYTHGTITSVNTPKEKSYAWIFESQAIQPDPYKRVVPIVDKFNLVFTHSSKLLNNHSNTRWIPGGGIWVGGTYGKGEIAIKEKNKMCSIVSSNKDWCELHKLRLEIVENFKNHNNVDVFGVIGGWKPVFESVENYRFSIVVENFQDELYFTEKILNCFATGTIPIYIGAKNISDKFNIDGIIQFNTIEELHPIINSLSEELYKSKKLAIEDNFNRCKQYRIIEDYIYKNYIEVVENKPTLKWGMLGGSPHIFIH